MPMNNALSMFFDNGDGYSMSHAGLLLLLGHTYYGGDPDMVPADRVRAEAYRGSTPGSCYRRVHAIRPVHNDACRREVIQHHSGARTDGKRRRGERCKYLGDGSMEGERTVKA